MYSIAGIINGKNSEDAVTVHRTASHPEQMFKILEALTTLGAVSISVVRN